MRNFLSYQKYFVNFLVRVLWLELHDNRKTRKPRMWNSRRRRRDAHCLAILPILRKYELCTIYVHSFTMQLPRKSRRSRKEKVLAKDIGLLDNKALLLLLKTLLGKKIVACRVPTRKIVACRTPGRKIVASRGQTCSSCSLSSPPQASQLVHQGKVLGLLLLPSGGKNGSNYKN